MYVSELFVATLWVHHLGVDGWICVQGDPISQEWRWLALRCERRLNATMKQKSAKAPKLADTLGESAVTCPLEQPVHGVRMGTFFVEEYFDFIK